VQCVLRAVSWMLISETVICDMLTNTSTPWCRATADTFVVVSRYLSLADMLKYRREPTRSGIRCLPLSLSDFGWSAHLRPLLAGFHFSKRPIAKRLDLLLAKRVMRIDDVVPPS
jgi:hypothetical protein